MKFTVKQSHIDAANKWLAYYRKWEPTAARLNNIPENQRTCNCPASRALLEHTGLKLGQVSSDCHWVDIDDKTYLTTGPLQSQINRWDCTGKFEPGEYEIFEVKS